jgi:hypothetical protein
MTAKAVLTVVVAATALTLGALAVGGLACCRFG